MSTSPHLPFGDTARFNVEKTKFRQQKKEKEIVCVREMGSLSTMKSDVTRAKGGQQAAGGSTAVCVDVQAEIGLVFFFFSRDRK